MERLAFVLAMGVAKDARNQDATKVLKVEQPTVRPMVEGGDARNLDVQRVLKEGLTSALHMVVGDVVAMREGAPKQHEVSQAVASGMAEERDVWLKAVLEVLRGRLGCAFLMVVDAVANSKVVRRVPKVVLHSARHMVVESDAYLLVARRERRVVLPCAKGMVVGSVASLTAVEYAQKVFMEAQTSVWHMVVGRGAVFLGVPRVHVAALIAA